MGFVIGAVVALIVIFLLTYITVKRPVFGEVVIVLSVLMIIVAVFFYFQTDKREEKKKNLIPLDEIQLSNISHKLAYGYYHKLTAHAKNLSKYRLQSINFNIHFYQCPINYNTLQDTDYSTCKLLIEKQHKLDIRLSAEQGRDIETYVLLDDAVLVSAYDSLSTSADGSLPAVGSIQWQVTLTNGVAR